MSSKKCHESTSSVEIDDWTVRMSKMNSTRFFFGLKFFFLSKKKWRELKKIISAEKPKTIRFQQIWSENWKESNNAWNTFLIFSLVCFKESTLIHEKKNWQKVRKRCVSIITAVGVRLCFLRHRNIVRNEAKLFWRIFCYNFFKKIFFSSKLFLFFILHDLIKFSHNSRTTRT